MRWSELFRLSRRVLSSFDAPLLFGRAVLRFTVGHAPRQPTQSLSLWSLGRFALPLQTRAV